MKKKNVEGNKKIYKNKSNIYLTLMIFAMVVVAIIMYKVFGKEEIYLVNQGIIEDVTSCAGFVIKDETVLNIDGSKVVVPTISEGSRVSKGNIIATYRGAEYLDYQKKLQDLDTQILQAMNDINIEYSVDIVNLENQVIDAAINAQNITSVVQMQECKNNINNLLSKRADIIGELSPKDAYIKELIARRKQLNSQMQLSSSNVKATIGGIVSYTIDGLEEKLTKNTIKELNYDDVKNYVEKREELSTNKIRITSNYEAYLLVRLTDIEKEYLEEDKRYTIKIIGAELNELSGKITNVTETEQGYEVLFRITNGIENLVDLRECEVEIVWNIYEGLVVPIKAIKENEKGEKFVKIISRGDYVDVPVKIERKNKTYAIVSNYKKENVNDYVLERYDRVVIQGN